MSHASSAAMGLALACALGACSDALWVDPLPAPPWEDETSTSGDTESGSSEVDTEDSETDSGTSGSGSGDGSESTTEVFVEFLCEEGGASFYLNYVPYVFHGHDGEVYANGNLSLLGVAQCPECPEEFDLTLQFEMDGFDYSTHTLTLAGLGPQDFYRFEMCASDDPPFGTTPYGSANFHLPEEEASEGLQYRLYTGGSTTNSVLPGDQSERDYAWPTDHLTTSGEAVGLAIALDPATDEVVATSFGSAAHQPTQTTQVLLPPWEPPLPQATLTLSASSPRYLQHTTFHQGYRGVPLEVNPTLFGGQYPGAWTAPGSEQTYPYLLIPDSLATESYLELRMLDASLQTSIDFRERRSSSIVGNTDVALLAPVLEDASVPSPSDPRYRWNIDSEQLGSDAALVVLSGCEDWDRCWSLVTHRSEIGEVSLPDEVYFRPISELALSPRAVIDYRNWAGWSSMHDGLIRLHGGYGWGYVAPPTRGAWRRWTSTTSLDG